MGYFFIAIWFVLAFFLDINTQFDAEQLVCSPESLNLGQR